MLTVSVYGLLKKISYYKPLENGALVHYIWDFIVCLDQGSEIQFIYYEFPWVCQTRSNKSLITVYLFS